MSGPPPPPPPPPAPRAPGPPPPPPLPEGIAAAATQRSNVKLLQWNKVTRPLQGSLWEELQRPGEPQSAPDFDVLELEKLFSAVVPKKDTFAKKLELRQIDFTRANEKEIILTKINMPLPDMMAAALAMDESILDADQVENLIKFCPNKEEMELLKNYSGDKEMLGKCEQFFLELMKVPRVESKLRVFLFKIQFNTLLTKLMKSLHTINSACDEVRTSSKLKEIMKAILYLGNALNQGTARGSALGFKLDSLLKLTDTRASNNKMTLMHYLCKVLAAKSPALLDFHVDLVSLEAATKIQVKSLAEEMHAITKGLEKVNQELTASADDGPVSQVFHKTLNAFIGFAESEVASIKNLYIVVGRNADALALYFNEDPVHYPFEQVTETLLKFVRLFRKVVESKQDKEEGLKPTVATANEDGQDQKSRKSLYSKELMLRPKEWQHLQISLEEIKVATKDFQHCIGKGGYGLVYKGNLDRSGKSIPVAIKRLNKQFGQGLKEFLTEVHLLSDQSHPNLISLLGYCEDDKEKILVYEYAQRGSLDKYLRRDNITNFTLTWNQRLIICVGAARGLDHLHNHVGNHVTIIHRDIKSGNILLDQNWVAKISDFGLSKLGFAGLDKSTVISYACGTMGYCEPEYMTTGILKKESDVYSFGMVLFEVLCGRLCTSVDDDGSLLSGPLAIQLYERKRLEEIIDPSLKEHFNSDSMNKFSEIAYRCLHYDRRQRPPMNLVVKELEDLLKIVV